MISQRLTPAQSRDLRATHEKKNEKATVGSHPHGMGDGSYGREINK